jgi:hypothetical protein
MMRISTGATSTGVHHCKSQGAGCWEIKGEYLGDELKFVVWVAPQ